MEVFSRDLIPTVLAPVLVVATVVVVAGVAIYLLTALVKVAIVLLAIGGIAFVLFGGVGGFSAFQAKRLKQDLARHTLQLKTEIARAQDPQSPTVQLLGDELQLCGIAERFNDLEIGGISDFATLRDYLAANATLKTVKRRVAEAVNTYFNLDGDDHEAHAALLGALVNEMQETIDAYDGNAKTSAQDRIRAAEQPRIWANAIAAGRGFIAAATRCIALHDGMATARSEGADAAPK